MNNLEYMILTRILDMQQMLHCKEKVSQKSLKNKLNNSTWYIWIALNVFVERRVGASKGQSSPWRRKERVRTEAGRGNCPQIAEGRRIRYWSPWNETKRIED